MRLPLSSAALQNRLTACLCHCNSTYEGLLLIQLCSDPSPMHCSTGLAKCIPHSPVLLCKTGLQHACVNAITPMKICCSYTCAVTHQCTAAVVLSRCVYHCPVVLCKTGSQHACVTAIPPMKVSCSYKCAVTHQQGTAALVLAKCIYHCPVLLCKTVCANASVQILSSSRFARTLHQFNATLFLAKNTPHCFWLTAHRMNSRSP